MNFCQRKRRLSDFQQILWLLLPSFSKKRQPEGSYTATNWLSPITITYFTSLVSFGL